MVKFPRMATGTFPWQQVGAFHGHYCTKNLISRQNACNHFIAMYPVWMLLLEHHLRRSE